MKEIPSLDSVDLGTREYGSVLALQHRLAAARAAGELRDTLLFVTHPPVITLGRRRASRDHVLVPGDTPVVQVERGGDATWHGPGQLVGYPIIALGPGERDVHRVLRQLEQALIDVLAALGIAAGRREAHTGVWCDGKKLASIGVAVTRWVTTHGFALNVDPDLGEFRRIQPCGLPAEVMGSLVSLGVVAPPRAALVAALTQAVAGAFGRAPGRCRVDALQHASTR